jgi:hypothetical protein
MLVTHAVFKINFLDVTIGAWAGGGLLHLLVDNNYCSFQEGNAASGNSKVLPKCNVSYFENGIVQSSSFAVLITPK